MEVKKAKLLIIGTVWPEPASSAAGTRMLQLISVFQSVGYNLVFASAAADSEFAFDLVSIGVEKISVELNNKSFDQFIKELSPQIVMFDRFMTEEQFGWRVAEQCPDAMRILDTEDLHCLRAARAEAFKANANYLNHLNNDIAKREIASIWRCDLSLIISEFEMKLLQEYYKVDKKQLFYLPFLVDAPSEEDISILPKFNDRKHFVSIGNFLHEPNWNAVLYLKEEIWPLIKKKLPDAEMHIYGAYPPQKAYQLHNASASGGLHILGRADDVNAVMQNARVLLAPLRIGAGLKGKFIDAMMNGTPSVTTAIGAEGMHAGIDWCGFIADTSEELADAAVRLYANEDAWKAAQDNGFEILNECFFKGKFEISFIRKIEELQSNLTAHRAANFTGSMLMHHSLQSTRYMAKWIEEKNKRSWEF